jgi:diadenosine tetraphosphate (Ap4A) HIT family hydrolase
MTERPCPFCTLDDRAILAANETAIAFHDVYPLTEGHTLVIPRRHVMSVFELEGTERDALWRLVAEVRAAILATPGVVAVNVGVNDGYAAGQTIPHGHVHLIPRRQGDCPDPRGGVRWIFPEKAKYWKDQGE